MLRLLFVLAPALVASHAAFAGITPIPVPEPTSLSLLAVGVGAAALYRRLRK
ncbi:MAG TPA: PEP-CTERM sorting domain-containing protein [Acetobacteraceae bacterium]